jgi:low molecular weight protein-tyrosine phosphatase
MTQQTGVLFVCLGNICRSPLAEGIFIHLANERGVLDRFDVDSCGTGNWHVGSAADARSIEVAARHGVHLPSQSRQVEPETDFERFDLLIAMDHGNERDLCALGAEPQQVRLMRSFDPALADASGPALDVPDPYYGPGDGFERSYVMLRAACEGLLDARCAKADR